MKNSAVVQLVGVLCIALSASCAKPANPGGRELGRDFTVTCTSAVANDVGACQISANARCKEKKAQLRGVMSSAFIPASNLYQNTARYRCLGD